MKTIICIILFAVVTTANYAQRGNFNFNQKCAGDSFQNFELDTKTGILKISMTLLNVMDIKELEKCKNSDVKFDYSFTTANPSFLKIRNYLYDTLGLVFMREETRKCWSDTADIFCTINSDFKNVLVDGKNITFEIKLTKRQISLLKEVVGLPIKKETIDFVPFRVWAKLN